MMKKRFFRWMARILIPCVAVLNCPIAPTAIAADTPPLQIEISHSPVEEATAGQRVIVEAEITDPSGVAVARAYFKATEAKEYSFVPLNSTNGEDFTGTLPAPANGSGSFEYLILVKNGNNQVVKSQTYTVTVKDDSDAATAVAQNEKINVYTELEQAPAEITGFSDNIVVDVVESAAKLGVVAGIYTAATAGSSSSGAVAAGTVAASSGVSTAALITGGLLVAAAAGGVAAAASSSSDDDDDSSSARALTASTIVGTWNVAENTRGTVQRFTLTFNPNGTYTTSGGSPGSWNLSGTTLTLRPNHGGTWTGTVSGDSQQFTLTGPTTAVFTR